MINLGNGRPFLLRDFISLVEKCVGKQAIIQILPEQPGDVERTCADISKARALLGYDPQVTFEEGIRITSEWYKQAHGDGLFDETAEAFFPVTADPIKRQVSDLELSSFVQKAPTQMTNRSQRIIKAFVPHGTT